MINKLAVLALALLAGQGSNPPVPIPVPAQSFELGYGQTLSIPLSTSPSVVQAPSPGWQYVTEGTYTFKFSAKNKLVNYPGWYNVEIDFGTQELCETYGWGTINSHQVTLACPGPGYLVIDKQLPSGGPSQGSQPFVLKFTVLGQADGFDGWPINFTVTSTSFTFTLD